MESYPTLLVFRIHRSNEKCSNMSRAPSRSNHRIVRDDGKSDIAGEAYFRSFSPIVQALCCSNFFCAHAPLLGLLSATHPSIPCTNAKQHRKLNADRGKSSGKIDIRFKYLKTEWNVKSAVLSDTTLVQVLSRNVLQSSNYTPKPNCVTWWRRENERYPIARCLVSFTAALLNKFMYHFADCVW